MGAKEVIGIARNPGQTGEITAIRRHQSHQFRRQGCQSGTGRIPGLLQRKGLPGNYGWKIFEWTGTGEGQAIALELLSFVGTLVIAGYGMQKSEYMFSRLMAFDADIKAPGAACLNTIRSIKNGTGRENPIEPFVETRPMSQIQAGFCRSAQGRHRKRIVLTTGFLTKRNKNKTGG